MLLVASRRSSNPRFGAYRVGYGLCDKRASRLTNDMYPMTLPLSVACTNSAPFPIFPYYCINVKCVFTSVSSLRVCTYNAMPVFVHCCQERHVHVYSVLIRHAGVFVKPLLTSFVRPSVRMKHLENRRSDFHEILYWEALLQFNLCP